MERSWILHVTSYNLEQGILDGCILQKLSNAFSFKEDILRTMNSSRIEGLDQQKYLCFKDYILQGYIGMSWDDIFLYFVCLNMICLGDYTKLNIIYEGLSQIYFPL